MAAARTDPATAAIPIVLLSARSRADDVQGGRAAGADAYVVKPFTTAQLVEAVRSAMAVRAARRR